MIDNGLVMSANDLVANKAVPQPSLVGVGLTTEYTLSIQC